MRKITPGFTGTTRQYSVALQCCDPVVQAIIINTDSRTRSEALFKQLVIEERKAGGGGEFAIDWWRHRHSNVDGAWSGKRPTTFKAPDIEDNLVVYGLEFEHSDKLGRYSYMDLLREQSDKTVSPPRILLHVEDGLVQDVTFYGLEVSNIEVWIRDVDAMGEGGRGGTWQQVAVSTEWPEAWTKQQADDIEQYGEDTWADGPTDEELSNV